MLFFVFAFFFIEKRAAATELYCRLEALNEAQFRTVIVDCVEFCKEQLGANFSPLAQVLQVKNYKITGDYVRFKVARSSIFVGTPSIFESLTLKQICFYWKIIITNVLHVLHFTFYDIIFWAIGINIT